MRFRSKRPRSRRRRSWIGRIVVATLALAVALLGSSFAAVLALRFVDPPVTAVMLWEPGRVGDIDYRWVDRQQISVAAARAVIAAEDQKFLEHRGFDLDELAAAVESYRDGGELRGASTITQQVAKNVFLWNGRSFLRKAVEAYLTAIMEFVLPKERILEIYLNVAELGPGVFGVEAASVEYYGRHAAELNSAQAALLAAVLPSPKRMSAAVPGPYVRVRQAEILAEMGLLDVRGHYRGLEW
jgi:monofunctional biosynthetic peptidoglycan transglycosylase